jgi:TetR/AcrR family transcriptional repressor of mexJK operon
MSIISRESRRRTPRADDPRVVRSRAAVVEAGRTLFLRQGYAGTTMEEIAALAGVTKRTVYNNYADKAALFLEIVGEATGFAGAFAQGLPALFADGITAATLRPLLHDLAQRMVAAILRPEVIALRRLLISEAQAFPALAADYFDRAPGQVMDALAAGFAHLDGAGLLRVADARRAAGQFAYLVVGEPLDRAMLVGMIPQPESLTAGAREGVETFLARYGAG